VGDGPAPAARPEDAKAERGLGALSVFIFARLRPDAGAAVSGKLATAGEAQPAAAE
jgi:hypothetical protein